MAETIERLIEDVMVEAHIPALAIAVMHAGRPVMRRAFGLRDVERGLPATTDTRFNICSLTKSFTATGLAMLVEAGKLDWDRPVRRDMPDFRLKDPVASEAIALRDMLAHRSGLPRHDWVWLPGDRTRADMFAALPALEPSRPFRSAYQYQNLIYMAAGMLAERVSGMSWEDFTRTRLLEPLGMTQYSFTAEALQRSPDAAQPYSLVEGRPRRAAFHPIPTTPAGGINASIDDMARYLRFLLGFGAFEGRRLLSEASARLLQTPQIHCQAAEYDELGDAHYALGFDATRYRGEAAVRHTGMWIGWGSYIAMLPERGTGMIVLTNRTYSPLLEFLSYMIFDALCGFPPAQWMARGRAKIAEAATKRAQDRTARGAIRTPAPPTHKPADYAGSFEHPAYGRAAIAVDGGALRWRGLGVDATLAHRGGDVFAFPDDPEDDPDSFIRLAGMRVSFGAGAEGGVERLALPLEPQLPDAVFRRRPG